MRSVCLLVWFPMQYYKIDQLTDNKHMFCTLNRLVPVNYTFEISLKTILNIHFL